MDLVLHTDASYRNDLDTGKFARMLDDPSQCYKFYWLEAILNLMPTEEGDISFEQIIDEIVVLRDALQATSRPDDPGQVRECAGACDQCHQPG